MRKKDFIKKFNKILMVIIIPSALICPLAPSLFVLWFLPLLIITGIFCIITKEVPHPFLDKIILNNYNAILYGIITITISLIVFFLIIIELS
jgi:thiosulfate reductase cytochrome b subunit